MSRKKMNEQLLQRMNEQLESLQAFVDDWDEMYQECCERWRRSAVIVRPLKRF